MSALYDQNTALKSHQLAQLAKVLRQESGRSSCVAPLVFMSDPERVPDLPTAIGALPHGCAVIYRHFGAANRKVTARLLREATQSAGQQLLIGGGDADLALSVGADGVHFKRDAELVGPFRLRKQHPNMLITMAALKGEAYQAPFTCLDGLFVSSIFPSGSPSAGSPIGTQTLKTICAELSVPVFALGGITQQTAPRLKGTGISGFAAIGGLMT
ncbi:MAG: thiamine phosphate synthase [Maricaulaceae bacterium]